MGTLRKASRASAANMNSVLPVEGGSTLTSNVKKAVQRMTILGRAGSSKVLGIGGSGNSNHNNDHGVKIANKTELMKNIRVGRNMYLTKKKSEDGARSFKSLLYNPTKITDDKTARPHIRGREVSLMERPSGRPEGSGHLLRLVTRRLEGGQPGSPANPTHPLQQRLSGRRGSNVSILASQSTLQALAPKLVNADGEWAVHPDDTDYHRWYMLTLLLVIYNSVMLPFDLMFYDHPTGVERYKTFWFWFDTTIDFTFLLDLWITFRVGFLDEKGDVVVSRDEIRYMYIWKGTFFIDLMSSIPFDLLLLVFLGGNTSGNESILSYLALAKTFRLLRIGRLAKYMSDQGIVSFIRIVRILFIYLMLAHWGGCVFYLIMKGWSGGKTWISRFAFENGYAPEDADNMWEVDFSFLPCDTIDNSTSTDANSKECYTIPAISQYWIVMYQSMMIMMGDGIDAQNDAERIYAVVMSLVGACLTAMMFGQMTQIVSGMDREEARYDEMMSNVSDQVSQLALLPETHQRVKDYYEFQWRINSGMDRKQFLASLSPCLRNEILLSVYADVVANVPFFQVPEAPDLITMIVLALETAFFLPSDVIVHEGEITTPQSCLYFLTLGTVAVFKEDRPDKILTKMSEGAYFGEMGYLSIGSQRTSSICALTNCDVAMLKFEDIDELTDMYPAFSDRINKEARKKFNKFKDRDTIKSTMVDFSNITFSPRESMSSQHDGGRKSPRTSMSNGAALRTSMGKGGANEPSGGNLMRQSSTRRSPSSSLGSEGLGSGGLELELSRNKTIGSEALSPEADNHTFPELDNARTKQPLPTPLSVSHMLTRVVEKVASDRVSGRDGE